MKISDEIVEKALAKDQEIRKPYEDMTADEMHQILAAVLPDIEKKIRKRSQALLDRFAEDDTRNDIEYYCARRVADEHRSLPPSTQQEGK